MGKDDRVLDDLTYDAIGRYATSALDGYSTGPDAVSDIVEFEVGDGLFVGIDPANDDSDVVFQLYLYVADLQSYTTKDGTINDHTMIAELRQELYALLETTFDETPLDWDAVEPRMSETDFDDGPGQYYVLEIPVTALGCA